MYSAASRSVTNGFRPFKMIESKNRCSQDTGSGEPQCQLTIRTEMPVDECRNRRGQGITGKIETAHNFPRDILRGILRPMFAGIECEDANRVTVLAGHQVADDGPETNLKCGGYVGNDANDPQPTLQRLRE